MSVDFVGENEQYELYCVDGSHMFELDVHAHPDDMLRLARVFSEWAKFVEGVAAIHADGNG